MGGKERTTEVLLVERLLDKFRGDANTTNNYDQTLLLWATLNSHEAVDLAADHSHEFNQTPLWAAAFRV